MPPIPEEGRVPTSDEWLELRNLLITLCEYAISHVAQVQIPAEDLMTHPATGYTDNSISELSEVFPARFRGEFTTLLAALRDTIVEEREQPSIMLAAAELLAWISTHSSIKFDVEVDVKLGKEAP